MTIETASATATTVTPTLQIVVWTLAGIYQLLLASDTRIAKKPWWRTVACIVLAGVFFGLAAHGLRWI